MGVVEIVFSDIGGVCRCVPKSTCRARQTTRTSRKTCLTIEAPEVITKQRMDNMATEGGSQGTQHDW